jgi:DNA-binding MarR family transcriptional regulator
MRITQAQIQALAGFRSALRRFLAFSEGAAKSAGITTQQYQVLLAIKAAADSQLTIGSLADELLLKPNGAVQLVDRLSAMNLVQRATTSSNKRAVLVQLTDRGDAMVLDLMGLHLGQLSRRKKQFAAIVKQLKNFPAN